MIPEFAQQALLRIERGDPPLDVAESIRHQMMDLTQAAGVALRDWRNSASKVKDAYEYKATRLTSQAYLAQLVWEYCKSPSKEGLETIKYLLEIEK